jgi:hypothetical protein
VLLSRVRLLALPANIRLGRKDLTGTNSLAYLAHSGATKKNVLQQWLNVLHQIFLHSKFKLFCIEKLEHDPIKLFVTLVETLPPSIYRTGLG